MVMKDIPGRVHCRGSIAIIALLFVAACTSVSLPDHNAIAEDCRTSANNEFDLLLKPIYPPHETPAITGDFDGDGQDDILCIGMKEGSDTGWLFVQFGVSGGYPRVISLEHFSPDTPVTDIRIFIESPNTFITRCGYMPDECSPEKPLKLEMTHESIFLVVLEASGILIYWDAEVGAFKREWLID